MKSILSRSIVGGLISLTLFSCAGSGENIPLSLTIHGDKTEMMVGEIATLDAAIEPLVASQEVTWSLSDSLLASISVEANVATITGLSEGSLVVSATSTEVETVTNSYTITINALPEPDYVYEGTLTEAPYTVFSQLGVIEGTWDSMTRALHEAGKTGLSTNKNYIIDANGLEIFRRGSKSTWWCYDGDYFVGSKPATEAKAWGESHERAYVIDGQATGYVQLGIKQMVPEPAGANYELSSGAYNYMFSKPGVVRTETAGGNLPGYYYGSANIRLSEASYRPAEGNAAVDTYAQWNAYIFINHSDGLNIDLGLIGNYFPASNSVKWRMVRNCSYAAGHPDEDGGTFAVINPGVTVAEMTYNEATDDYRNADDLSIEVLATLDNITLKMKNLRTNQEFVHVESHPGYKTADKTVYGRMLLAASYCPVVGNLWDARNGGYLKNVVFDHVKIGKYQESGEYPESILEDFYPDTENVNNGFAQGADCADWKMGTHTAEGTYISGLPYATGEKWVSFSTFYDGSHDVYQNYRF